MALGLAAGNTCSSIREVNPIICCGYCEEGTIRVSRETGYGEEQGWKALGTGSGENQGISPATASCCFHWNSLIW